MDFSWRSICRAYAATLGLAFSLSVLLIHVQAHPAPKPSDQTAVIGSAAPQDDDLKAARKALKAKDYRTAAERFESAYRRIGNSQVIYEAMRAHQAAGQNASMANLAAVILERHRDDNKAVELAQQSVAEVRDRIHRVKVRCEPACRLQLDGKLSLWGEVSATVLYLEPGNHSVRAEWNPDRDEAIEVTAREQGVSELSFRRAPPPQPSASLAPPPAPTPSASPMKVLSPPVFYALAGTTTLLGAVTAWSMADMVSSPGKDRVRADCVGQGESCPTYQDGLSKQHRTNLLLGASVGMAAAATLVGLFFTRWNEHGGACTTPLTVGPAAAGAGVTIEGRGTF